MLFWEGVDINTDCYYDPVNLDHSSVVIRSGLGPSESDPRFHQQMVYVAASEIIYRFEFALGREIKGRRGGNGKEDFNHD